MKAVTLRRRSRRGGFTLLEVLLVLAILGVIAAMVVPNILGRQQRAMEDTTRQSIRGLEQALQMYAIDHDGMFPQGSQDALNHLLQPVDRHGRPMEPYLPDAKLPTDAWGEVLYYEYPSSKTPTDKPAVWSSGPNRRNEDGGGDDINNWMDVERSR
jgi:general secretion pathway protein G